MDWAVFLLDCCVAVVGGCLAAALSALGGFVLFGLAGVLGFLFLLVAGNDAWIEVVTGTVLLKPSVCFVGGVIATAYARRKGVITCGKDIGRPFIGHPRADILAVGGCAGLAGYLVNRGIDAFMAGKLDTVAVTVFLVPLVIKYAWRMTRTNDCEASSHAVPSPYRFFEKFSKPAGRTILALLLGVVTALLTVGLFATAATRPYAGLFVFFVSALSLFPLYMGIAIPATHHFTGPAGVAAAAWLSAQAGSPGGVTIVLAVLWGVVAAQLGLLAGEIMGKIFFVEGDIHIDPPAMGIMLATLVMLGGLPRTGLYTAIPSVQMSATLPVIVALLIVNVRDSHRPAKAAA